MVGEDTDHGRGIKVGVPTDLPDIYQWPVMGIAMEKFATGEEINQPGLKQAAAVQDLFIPTSNMQYICSMTSQLFTYNKGKVIQALRYHFISRSEIKAMMILVNVFAIVSASFFFFRKVSPVAFLVSSLLWFVLMISFWYLLPVTIYRKSATFKDKFKATLGTDEFTIENERGSRSWAWNEFTTTMESPHFFHLYFNARSFFIVPKEAFPDDEIIAARKLLATKIGRQPGNKLR